MDFSALNEAMAFKSYDKIADICDNLMLQVIIRIAPFYRNLCRLSTVNPNFLSLSLSSYLPLVRSQVASEGVAFQDEWPYAIHLLGHIYINDM